jgi:hypothetical protein
LDAVEKIVAIAAACSLFVPPLFFESSVASAILFDVVACVEIHDFPCFLSDRLHLAHFLSVSSLVKQIHVFNRLPYGNCMA